MGAPVLFKVDGFAGGLNDGLIATLIADDELASVRNYYPFNRELIARNGISRVTSTVYSARLTSLFGGEMDGTWELFVGSMSGIARKSGSALVNIPSSDGEVYASAVYPWRMKLYKNTVYAVRTATGRMKRVKTDFMSAAGIPAANTGPTLVQGAAGPLLAGNYYGVVTGYNTETGAESNPSPASAVCTIAASKTIDWSNIPTFATGQVNARRLYRTLLNQQGEYYFMGQLNDNFTTTWVGDNKLTADLGTQVSFKNGIPPSDCSVIEIWKERCILSDGRSVFYSEPFLPESFYAFSEIEVYPDDGHNIVQLMAFGDRLIIAKTNAIHYLVGTDSSDFSLLTLSDRHGCIAADSLRTAEGLIFWFEGRNFYRSDGSAVVAISDTKIRNLIDRIPDAYKSLVAGAVYPALSQYRATIPIDSDTTPSLTLVYNYRSGAWTVYDGPYGAPSFMGDFYDTDGSQLIYGVYAGNNRVFNLDSGDTDDGVPIVSTFDTKAFGMQNEGSLKGLHRVSLLTDSCLETMDLALIRDLSSSVYKTRNVTLNIAAPWKRYNLSNMGDLAKNIQIRHTYSGRTRIRVGGLLLETVAFNRASQPV